MPAARSSPAAPRRCARSCGRWSSRPASAICSSSSISATCAPISRARACGSSRPRWRRRCGAIAPRCSRATIRELADDAGRRRGAVSATMRPARITVAGHAVEIAEAGSGAPLLYLHGFADVHGAVARLSAVPRRARRSRSRRSRRPIPCCAGSDEDDEIETIDDLAFRYDRDDRRAGARPGRSSPAPASAAGSRPRSRCAIPSACAASRSSAPRASSSRASRSAISSGRRSRATARIIPACASCCSRAPTIRRRSRSSPTTAATRCANWPLQDDALCLAHRLQPALFLRPPAAPAPASLQGAGAAALGRARPHGAARPCRGLRDGLAGAELRIIAGAGHSPQVERPAKTAALISTFLRPPVAARNAAAKAKAVAAAPKAKAKRKAKARTYPPPSPAAESQSLPKRVGESARGASHGLNRSAPSSVSRAKRAALTTTAVWS